jgi:hypothetical protein
MANASPPMPASSLPRRRFLQSAGFFLGLPLFDTFLQKGAAAALRGPGTTAEGDPLRMAFLYIPNGVIGNRWKPEGVGADFSLNTTMQPLASFQKDIQVISGLSHLNGTAGGDGGGDHARACATILTGARPKKTAGTDIRAGVSVDQVAARHMSGLTRFPSLELSCDAVRQSGACDSGYSCAYQFNLSWRSATQPVAPESNPRAVFERLFGKHFQGGAAAFERDQARQRSMLDFLREDAGNLKARLGRNDQRKLDEYLTGVREIEQRIQGGLSSRPLMSVPHILSGESSAYYHGTMSMNWIDMFSPQFCMSPHDALNCMQYSATEVPSSFFFDMCFNNYLNRFFIGTNIF